MARPHSQLPPSHHPARSVRRTILGATTIAVVLAFVWIAFTEAMLGGFVRAATQQNVYVGGTYVGELVAFPLENLAGRWFMNFYFRPSNNDLSIINTYRLNWWQTANTPGGMFMEPPNGGYPGLPSDNRIWVYTNNERQWNATTSINGRMIFAGNRWWFFKALADAGLTGNSNNVNWKIDYQTLLINTDTNNNFSIVGKVNQSGWIINNLNGPFTNNKQDPDIVDNVTLPPPWWSGLTNNGNHGNYWYEVLPPSPGGAPLSTPVGLILLLGGLLVAASALMRRGPARLS